MSATTLEAPVAQEEPSSFAPTNIPAAKTSNASAVRLWQRYRGREHGDPIEEGLVREYLPLVKTVVGKLAMTLPAHVSQEDLYSAGLVGLLNAIRNYDPTNEASFESYARLRIRGAIIDELRSLDWVPRSVHAKARKVRNAMETVSQSLGRVPTEKEVARELGMNVEAYRTLLDEVKPTTFISINASTENSEGSDTSIAEAIPDERIKGPDDQANKQELVELIYAQLEELPEVQRKVLALYYFEDLRLREIAEVFGVTESRICQIHSQAVLSIRNYVRRHNLVHQ